MVSNGTISGTGLTVTSLQDSGGATVNSLTSNVYGVFGQNVTINSSNASTSYLTGALTVAGGIGVAGNVYTNSTFHGPLTGTATTATNLTVASSILAGNISISPGSVGKNSISTQTFTLTGLTTSHKVLVTSGTDLSYGVFITAAYASATNTISVQFMNVAGAQTPPTLNLHYFAWV